jgi:integrase
MSVSKLPSGKWRALVHVPKGANLEVHGNVSVGKVLGGSSTFDRKSEAVAAVAEAKKKVAKGRAGVTVRDFRDRWLTDRLFERPKASTMIHNRQQTQQFVDRYGDMPMRDITDEIVGEWMRGGRRNGQAKVLRAMFNDAASATAGRIIASNPWNGLRLPTGYGRRYEDPPTEQEVRALIAAAHEHSGPWFAWWLQAACYTGMRPGELDALKWANVDLEKRRGRVVEQFNHLSRTFCSPKNGRARNIFLAPPAIEALAAMRVQRVNEFCFVTETGRHWRSTNREHHWKRVRDNTGYAKSLYLSTRHFYGWYATNELQLDAEIVAIQLGHEDGGRLVKMLYGHRDRDRALDSIEAAFDRAAQPKRLRVVGE